MSKKETIAAAVVIAVLILGFTFLTPGGRENWNNWMLQLRKADDSTRYETKKEVEDACRAMRASYEADRLTYEQYRGQGGEPEEWAQQARIRANKTAAAYNQYVLRNSFVWQDNVPGDIRMELEYIEEESGP